MYLLLSTSYTTPFKMNVSVAIKWNIINITKKTFSIQRPGSDLPPITIALEEPLTDEKLKIIGSCTSNLQKVNEMPSEVIIDMWKAPYMEKYYLAKSGA